MTLPAIGTSLRDKIEAEAIEFADNKLHEVENIRVALSETAQHYLRTRGETDALDLVEHVHQVWIGRILR